MVSGSFLFETIESNAYSFSFFSGIIQIQLRKFTNYRKMQRLAQNTKYPI